MDDQPRTDFLTRLVRPRASAAGLLGLVAGAVVLAGCPSAEVTLPPELRAVGGQVSLLRIPLHGGPVEAFHPDSLKEPIWTTRADVVPLREVVGVNIESRLLLAVDTLKNLIAVDLESRGARPVGTGADQATLGPDGAVLVVNAGHKVTRYEGAMPVLFRAGLPVAPVFQAGTLGDRYLALLGTKPRQLVVLNAERQLHSAEVADGPVTATYWGDLVAVGGADGEITLVQTDEPFATRTVEADGPPTGILFSPSGHRLYVAHDRAGIEVFDRFSLDRIGMITLPGRPADFRTDQSGRWLIARATGPDSAWVVDLATGKLSAAIETEWAEDLPTVAGAATLIARRDGDVVSLDLTRPGTPETGRIAGGSLDRWLVTTWVPKERAVQAVAAAESAQVAQDSALVADSQTVAPADRLYLQISSSQNRDWSREFAKQLADAGYQARVIDPTNPDEGYRVVVGPFATRDAAEEAGRKLARPYFILTNPPVKQ